MTIALLIDELKCELAEAVKNIRLENKKNERVAVSLYTWRLPVQGVADEETNVPFILIGATDGSDGSQGGRANVQIDISTTFKDGQEGIQNVLTLLEHVRLALLRKPVIGKRFRLDGELKWFIPAGDDQPYPYWVTVIKADYSIPRPMEESGVAGYAQKILGDGL